MCKIEAKLGRLRHWAVEGKLYLDLEMENIRATVEAGNHLKEAVGINFRSFPDPFDAYLHKLDKKDVVEFSSEGGYQRGRPGIDLSVPYSPHGTALPVTSAAAPQEKVLNRIASLRRECEEEQRHEAVVRRVRRVETVQQDTPELEIVSDDEVPGEQQPGGLKLRRPGERRGIRSRNPDGLSSRRERERERGAGPGEGPGEGPSRAEQRAAQGGAHMDKESGRGGGQHKDRGGREEGGQHKDRGRWEEGGQNKDRSGEGHGGDRSSRQQRDRQGRDKRPHSRSRDRPDRSVSPYVAAMERWNKFKKAEAAMLAGVGRRREQHDKRPEDHPRYAVEWKLFWESRYKELQAAGRNPATHDFKAEWIPFWTAKVAQLFDSEVLQKTSELMKKFDLNSVAEPRREQFERKKRSRSNSRGRSNSMGKGRSRSRSRSRGRKSSSKSKRRSRSRSRERKEGGDREERRTVRYSGEEMQPSREKEGRGSVQVWERPPKQTDLQLQEMERRGRGESQYSGLTELEDRRDRGRSPPSPGPAPRQTASAPEVLPTLRLLSALEDSLGSLGPQVNTTLGRALGLEQGRPGASRILLEDPATAALLDTAREKLRAGLEAGLLAGPREGAVCLCLESLDQVLKLATSSRSDLSSLAAAPLHSQEEEDWARGLVAETLASQLVAAGRADMSDTELEQLLEELLQLTAKEDPHSTLGRLAQSYSRTRAAERQLAARLDPPHTLAALTRPELHSTVLGPQDQSSLTAARPGSSGQDWSPMLGGRRKRRLSGSDLDMNPVAPDSQLHEVEEVFNSRGPAGPPRVASFGVGPPGGGGGGTWRPVGGAGRRW